jgi:hypothetical protein
MTNRDLARRIGPATAGGLSSLLIAYMVTSPSRGVLALLVYGGMSLAIALFVPPHVFVAGALLVVGVSTAFPSAIASVGPAVLYVSDLAVLVILCRGVLPRARHPGRHALQGGPQALFILWLLIMAIAGGRAFLAGVPTASVIRADLALFYWPILYFGFARVLSEVNLDRRLLWRNLALVAAGFAFYMLIARALNHPFQDPGLAQVPTGPEETVPRNFGFASAFTIYPMLALAGIAAMANIREHRAWWSLLASLGLIATLTTLVRGEIFALGLGILLVLWLSPRRSFGGGRARTTAQIAVALAATMLVVLAVDPRLGHAVVQRALPFTHQASEATANADYRFEAMSAGVRVAKDHLAGLGVLDQRLLLEHKIDPGYLAHSGFATLLLVGGWFALAAAVLTLLALVRRSFELTSSGWLHPAFVAAITTLSVYSLGAAGLVGDSWVIPLGALIVALRFNLRPNTD